MRIHVISALLVVVLGAILQVNIMEWCLLFIAIAGVISAELFNTALEILGDRITTEWDESIKNIKDIAAAAVLVWALIALIAGCFIFLPKLWALWVV